MLQTTQDCDEERDVFGDGEIEISVNRTRPEAPVWWRWVEEDQEYRPIALQTADLPTTEAQVIAFIRIQLDLDQ
ncbi:hypothetical protein [Geopseudomonas aromaticivorans]